MVMLHSINGGRVLYARPDIEVFHGIERFSDYKKTKRRMRRSLATDTSKGRTHSWRLLRSDKGLTAIIAIGTVALVLLAVATLIVTLL